MKKVVSLFLALALCLSLAACGGPDKQPAIDAHNKAVDAVNALGELINADPSSFASEDIEQMNQLVETLDKCGAALEGNTDVELDQEALDEWVQVCGEIEQWAKDAKAQLEG